MRHAWVGDERGDDTMAKRAEAVSASQTCYDVIGDVHGHADALKRLLGKLGYSLRHGVWQAPPGRRAIFVGDFIDRGDQIEEVLQIASQMMEAGVASAVMGNHEFSALQLAYQRRPPTPTERKRHAATFAQFDPEGREWANWIEWMRTLPLFLDLGIVRVVHACWHPTAIELIGIEGALRDEMLAAKPAPSKAAAHLLLNGPEIDLPDGLQYGSPDHRRSRMRARWWINHPLAMTYDRVQLQVPIRLPSRLLTEDERRRIPGYPKKDVPVLFGHYGYRKPAAPIKHNVACIDLGITRGGPLCAVRLYGQRRLRRQDFVISY